MGRPKIQHWIHLTTRAIALGLAIEFVPPTVMALEREPNTTLTVPVSPPVYGYHVETAFGTLRFTDPLAITTPPGETNRLFVVEQGGRITVIQDLATPTRTVFLDISSRIAGGQPTDARGLLGLEL